MNAADYGAPQTRRRAVLLAHLDRHVQLPAPTHAEDGAGGLPPWRSMADALGCGDGIVGFPRRADSGDVIELGGTDYRARDLRPTSEPAHTVTEKVRSWSLMPGTYAFRADGNRRVYGLDEPAPTLAFGHDSARWLWVLNTGRDWKPGGSRDDAQTIPLDRPAPTVAGAGSQWQWRTEGAAERVTVAQAGVLQTFPADYPWQGPSHDRYQQVGNAVPPLLAAALLEDLIR